MSREDEVTIGELAEQVGMTVRNVRAHQTRGLIPPPRLVGRVGYYGPVHRHRLQQIQAMQAEGLNLAAIAKAFDTGQLGAVGTDLFRPPAPRRFTRQELAAVLGDDLPYEALARGVELGIMASDGETIEMRGPGLLEVAVELLEMGVPLADQVEVLGAVSRAVGEVAAAYLALADEHIMGRLVEEHGEDPDALRATLERLNQLARSTLQAAFDQAAAQVLTDYFAIAAER